MRLRSELDAVLTERCGQRSLAGIQRRTDEAGIGNAPLNGVHDLAEHPQLALRGRWRDVDTPVGPAPALIPPALGRHWDVPRGVLTARGEHTDALRAESAGLPDSL